MDDATYVGPAFKTFLLSFPAKWPGPMTKTLCGMHMLKHAKNARLVTDPILVWIICSFVLHNTQWICRLEQSDLDPTSARFAGEMPTALSLLSCHAPLGHTRMRTCHLPQIPACQADKSWFGRVTRWGHVQDKQTSSQREACRVAWVPVRKRAGTKMVKSTSRNAAK